MIDEDERQEIRQVVLDSVVKTPYRIRAKNMFEGDNSGETLMMYIPEYRNDYTGYWTKIHKCIQNKKPVYFFDLEEARAACLAHAKKQGEIVWAGLL